MRIVGIERLIHWALVVELPKGRDVAPPGSAVRSSWAMVERTASLGVIVDGGGFAPSVCEDEPDPDAAIVAAAIADLDDGVVAEGDEHDLLAGWPDFGVAGDRAVRRAWDLVSFVDEFGRRHLRSSLANLVRSVAILGRWPEWECEEPQLVDEVGPEGKPRWFRLVDRAVRWNGEGAEIAWEKIEIDGYDRRRGRPHAGAYRRRLLSPDPSAKLAARIEYELVHTALVALADRLDGLGGRKVLPPTASPIPWGRARSPEAGMNNLRSA